MSSVCGLCEAARGRSRFAVEAKRPEGLTPTLFKPKLLFKDACVAEDVRHAGVAAGINRIFCRWPLRGRAGQRLM